MDRYEIITLVDITNTGAHRPQHATEHVHNQYRNWITLTQCIGLRSIIHYDENPTSGIENVESFKFGKTFKGPQRIWRFIFGSDRSNAYTDDAENPIGLLIADLDDVPIIKNLDETVNINKAVLNITDPQHKNTIVRAYMGI
jgi:hypothetical protein